ncbi:allantoinase [Amycolatopsis antarctica]|uniref:allantoinase n=1 Tax=Amycolatopsis antarctica TaxID=1854586 RepID=A0A263D9G3_9PSEU|nr:allantoinase AllB [Amycolatopsis antarctica]OZM74116.1 allantoinase [Amycolatopsis antarctica]
MSGYDTVFRASRAITTDGERACEVGVLGGRIAAVEPLGAGLGGTRTVEFGDQAVLLPGLVDTHVHVNDPGRDEWEGFETATLAAAAGGVTTIIDMPLNSLPPTVDVPSLAAKRAAANGRIHVDVGFWGGAIPGNLGELAELHGAGVFGFKCFLLHSGVDEFPPLEPDGLEHAMRTVRSLGAQLIVHAEDAGTIEAAPDAHGVHYGDFLRSRPPEAEDRAIERVLDTAARTGARVHILHLSSSDSLARIARARADGVEVTVETCPHYLTFTGEQIADGATQFKCCPPIREAGNRDRLWEGLADGLIDCVVTDHSPCTPELKRLDTGDFGLAWGGISGLQLGLAAVWTQARERGHALADVVRWMSAAPAAQAGLRRKGAIEVGRDADLAVFAPEEEFLVRAERLRHRNPVSAYDGRTLRGVVRGTWLRGTEVDGVTAAGTMLIREG